MTPTRNGVLGMAALTAALVLPVLLALYGCSSAPKAPEPVETEKPVAQGLLAGGDYKNLLGQAKAVLSELGVECDSTLQLNESTDSALPRYDFATNVIFLPRDADGEAFYRAAMYAVGAAPSQVVNFLPDKERKAPLGRFICNVFLLHELGAYLRHQYKSFDHLNRFNESEFRHEFARLMVESLLARKPEPEDLCAEFAAFCENLLARAPKGLLPTSQESVELKQWFDKTFAAERTESQSENLLYKLLRALAYFREDPPVPISEFTGRHIFDPGTGVSPGGLTITFVDKSLQVYTIHRGSRPALRRVGHSHLFRGLSGVAVDPGGRVFFSDYASIRQVAGSRLLDMVKGSQGVFAPTGFCVSADGKFYFTDREMVRVVDFPVRKVANISLGAKLEGSVRVDPHVISPIAVSQAGDVLIVNNSSRTLYRIGGDGSMLGSVTLSGVVGGIAVRGGEVYVTNTSSHTVDKVDFSGAIASVAGVRGFPGHGDGKGFEVFFNSPTGICINKDGVVFVADTYNHAIRAIATDGAVTTVAGLKRGNADGKAEYARLHCPVGVAVDGNGNLYVAELASERLVIISASVTRPESKPVETRGLSGLESPDREIAALSKEIKNSAVGYRLFDTYVARGIRYRTLRDYESSLADFQRAMSIAPEKLSAYVEAGLTREARGDINGAVETYTRAINMKEGLTPVEQFHDRNLLRALMQRAAARARLGSFELAIEDLTRALKTRYEAVKTFKQPDLAPREVAEMWFARGKIYIENGQTEKAFSDLDKAIVQDPRFAAAYHYRALTYKARQQYDSAVKDLLKATSLDPGLVEPHYVLGQIYQSDIIDNQKATQHFKTYIALEGANQADARMRIEEIKSKLDRTVVEDEPYTETEEEDAEGRLWTIRKYASGRIQKFRKKEK